MGRDNYGSPATTYNYGYSPYRTDNLCAPEVYPGAEEMPEAYPDDRTVPGLGTNVKVRTVFHFS